jgi:putative endonuclease
MVQREYCVYIMCNYNNTTLYTGVTNDLKRRVYEHKQNVKKGFTSRYKLHKLVYFEVTNDIKAAIQREKQIKGGSRQKKVELINKFNPDWLDLSKTIF